MPPVAPRLRSEVAELVSGRLIGPDGAVERLRDPAEATASDIIVILSERQLPLGLASPAGLVILPDSWGAEQEGTPERAFIGVGDVHAAWEVLLTAFAPRLTIPMGLDARAIVHETALIGEGVHIGAGAVVASGASIGRGTVVQSGAFIGEDVRLGDDCLVRVNATILHGAVIGNRCIIHPGVVIGSDGFGYRVKQEGGYAKLPHIGGVVLEDDVEVGANSVIDRGTVRDVIIGCGTKIGPVCIVAHNARVGERVAMIGAVQMGGSVTIEDDAVLMGQVGLAGHLTIGRGATVTAQSGVTKSLAAGGTYRGLPARPIKQAMRIEARVADLEATARRVRELEQRLKELESRLAAVEAVE